MLLESLVEKYLTLDPNPTNRRQISDLRDSNNVSALRELLCSRIAFGTAGLRAKMEAGFSRLNEVTVLQASQGLAKYAQLTNPGPYLVVVGHDHRHNSQNYARITASVFSQLGYKVYFLESPDSKDSGLVATPFVPFAVDYYGADVGVMITASHNPAADNGYKVYWRNGCQIIPPNDSGISAEIEANLEPWDGVWDKYESFSTLEDGIVYAKEEITLEFYKSLETKLIIDTSFSKSSYSDLKFVYTPVHGVGAEFVRPVFNNIFGLSESENYFIVEKQEKPDPDFSTVSFPNPEEKGALDLAIKTANEKGVDLILANDPDADRFSAAIRISKTSFRQLTGNELGFLFAWYVVEMKQKSGSDLSKVYVLNSTVSSQMIGSMAKVLGCNYSDTLTGFKWIGNKAIELEKEGFHVPFGYEEAIGFMFGNVHDKDGLAATTAFLQMYNEYTVKQGLSLLDKLDEGFKKFGYFKEHNGYYKFTDSSISGKIFDSIRQSYNGQPEKIGEYKVLYWRDLTIGYESGTKDNIPGLPCDKLSNMVTAILEAGETEFVRFTARGSGTEPKLKVYIEGKASSEEKAEELASKVWKVLRNEWFKPETYGLQEVEM